MNKVIQMGNLVRDPELKTVNDKAVCNFTIAVQDKYKKDEADFLNCVAWEKTGEFINKYFHKGTKISIIGRLKTRTWEKDGQKHYATDIIVEEAYFCESKKDEFKKADDTDDGLPF